MGRSATNTREKLIDTAKDLIWRDSYNAVSVDDICKKADVQKGSFYHYFPSKAHLALETMDACMSETLSIYNDIFSPVRPAKERFERMIDHVIAKQKEAEKELGRVGGCPYATLGSELAAQDEEMGVKITDICQKKKTFYESALRDLKTDGLIDPGVDVVQKANEIFALILGQLIMARIQNDLTNLEQNLQRAVFDLIGLKNKHLTDQSNLKRKAS